ncbi:MAG: CvpA family protein [Armatimonadetes bacterium]|nr:CvpA family protein [Armatimonadota bacterium]
MNWIDFVIAAAMALSMWIGLRRGFLVQCLELLAVALSLLVAVALSGPAADLLGRSASIPRGAAGLVGFVAVWLAAQMILGAGIRLIDRRIPRSAHRSLINRIAGIVPSAAKTLVLCALIASFIVVFPAQGLPKEEVLASTFGRVLVDGGTVLERQAAQYFGEDLRSLFAVKVVNPGSGKAVMLPFKVTNAVFAPEAAQQMLDLVNQERISQNPPLVPLTMNKALQEVARKHADDMFKKGYFSHINREGLSPFDRMAKAKIRLRTAGENLALAQTVEMAHVGLMNSPGHRRNILSRDFRQVGIAALDGGIRGIMFVQVFSD